MMFSSVVSLCCCLLCCVVIFFFLMIRRPPRSTRTDTHFPYTTLFRSLKRIQGKYGRDSIGAITSSRCTNEETWLVQKLVRAAFGTNNIDTCEIGRAHV